MVNVNQLQTYESKIPIDLEQFKQGIFVKESENWQIEIQNMAKLRTYRIFKQTFGQEAYLCSNTSKIERSHLAQFRFGILPLKIEIGRFIGQALPERICNLCQLNEIENEIHFLIKCPKYETLCQVLYQKIISTIRNHEIDINSLDDNENIKYLLNEKYLYTSKIYLQCFSSP